MRKQISPATVRYFTSGKSGVRSADPDEVIRLIREAPQALSETPSSQTVWIDITNPGSEESELLRDQIGLHPLAVEDCLRGRQRPKIDRYPGYYLFVFYAARINQERARMALNEIHVFLGTTFLITVHDQQVPEVARVVDSWRMDPERLSDPGTLAHALLDLIIDDYYPVLEHFSDRLEEMEHQVFNDPEPTIEQAFLLRQEMITMRRVLTPERDALSSLVRHDLPFVRPRLVPYFQDAHDHVLRVTEEIDAFRDVLTGLVEYQTTKASNRLNEVVQTLTAWSIILMTISMVTGIYGMNFDAMPELHLRWGYFASLGLMAAVSFALLIYFRRKKWL
ncbi:MAG: magnesium/cobalt transporter CorA [Gemmatimonadota bacterium]|jgi:magnesium transporter|nr:magnesium/cobalt transporter CorA [Gemmatimonadota bacterium]